MEYKNIPIFIISHNRLNCLKDQLEAFTQRGYKNIKIIDNLSTYEPLLEFYKEHPEYEVLYMDKNYGHTVFVDTYLFEKYGKRDYYAITDSDVVPVENCPDNFLEYFYNLLRVHRVAFGKFIYKAGFGLKLDDLPNHFKLKAEVIGWEKQFWENEVSSGVFQGAIDTTFALYRPGIPMTWAESLRTGDPYIARHTTWYLDYNNLPEDELYYKSQQLTTTHWSGHNGNH